MEKTYKYLALFAGLLMIAGSAEAGDSRDFSERLRIESEMGGARNRVFIAERDASQARRELEQVRLELERARIEQQAREAQIEHARIVEHARIAQALAAQQEQARIESALRRTNELRAIAEAMRAAGRAESDIQAFLLRTTDR